MKKSFALVLALAMSLTGASALARRKGYRSLWQYGRRG